MCFFGAYTPLLILLTVSLSEPETEFLLKPMGDLYFSDTPYVLKFDFGLNGYYSNAKLLHHNTVILDKMCNEGNNSILYDCIYFRENLKNVSDLALREVSYIESSIGLSREKRGLICLALVACGTAIVSAIAGFVAGIAFALTTQRDIVKQNNVRHNITRDQFQINDRFLKMNNESTNVLTGDLYRVANAQYINQLMFSSLLALDRHHQDTNKYFSILNDDLKTKFFSVVDATSFQEAVQSIKNSKIRNSPIFALKMRDIIELSNLEAELLNHTIRVNVYIPLTTGDKLKMYGFIPIPHTRENSSFILTSNSKHLIRNVSTFSEIPNSVLINCLQYHKLTICDDIPFHGLLPLDDCLMAIIHRRNSEALCTYESIPHKTQIVKISEDTLYVHIVKPLSLRIACGENHRMYNLTKSKEINFGKYCKISTNTNHISQYESSTIVQINREFVEPKFSVLSNATWKSIEFLNRHNLEAENLALKLQNSYKYFKENSKILNHTDIDLFRFIPNFLLDEIIKIVFIYVLIPIFIFISVSCCLCRCFK